MKDSLYILPLVVCTLGCAGGVGPSGPGITSFDEDEKESYGTDGDTGPIDTDGDTDGPMPEMGHKWCVIATNASYDDVGGGGVTPIYYDGTMDSPIGCACAPDELHDWLSTNAVNGEVDVSPSASPPDDIVTLRQLAYNDAEVECVLEAPSGFDNNCDPGNVEDGALDAAPSSSGFQYPVLQEGDHELENECVVVRFYVGGEYDPPGPSCGFMTGSYSFSVSSNGALEVDTGLVSKILQAPGCLYSEGGRIDWTGTEYEFTGISRLELLWELGLRDGDIPQSLNGYDVTTVDGAYEAWVALQQETDFQLDIDRPHVGSTTLKFVLN